MLPSFIKNEKILNEVKIKQITGVNLNSKKINFYELQKENNNYYFENKKDLIKFLEQKL